MGALGLLGGYLGALRGDPCGDSVGAPWVLGASRGLISLVFLFFLGFPCRKPTKTKENQGKPRKTEENQGTPRKTKETKENQGKPRKTKKPKGGTLWENRLSMRIPMLFTFLDPCKQASFRARGKQGPGRTAEPPAPSTGFYIPKKRKNHRDSH